MCGDEHRAGDRTSGHARMKRMVGSLSMRRVRGRSLTPASKRAMRTRDSSCQRPATASNSASSASHPSHSSHARKMLWSSKLLGLSCVSYCVTVTVTSMGDLPDGPVVRGACGPCGPRSRVARPSVIGPVGVAFWFTHSDARSVSKLNSSTTAAEVSLVVFWPLKLCERSPKPSSSKAANSVG